MKTCFISFSWCERFSGHEIAYVCNGDGNGDDDERTNMLRGMRMRWDVLELHTHIMSLMSSAERTKILKRTTKHNNPLTARAFVFVCECECERALVLSPRRMEYLFVCFLPISCHLAIGIRVVACKIIKKRFFLVKRKSNERESMCALAWQRLCGITKF